MQQIGQINVPLTYGSLSIKPIEAQLTHDTDFFTKMSPFIIFTSSNNQKVTSSICQHGGKKPNWNEQHQLNVSSQDTIVIELWDHHNIRKTKLIGRGELHVSRIIAMGGVHQDYLPLFHNSEIAGNLYCLWTYHTVQGQNGPPQQVYHQIQANLGQQTYYSQPLQQSEPFRQQENSQQQQQYVHQETIIRQEQGFSQQHIQLPQETTRPQQTQRVKSIPPQQQQQQTNLGHQTGQGRNQQSSSTQQRSSIKQQQQPQQASPQCQTPLVLQTNQPQNQKIVGTKKPAPPVQKCPYCSTPLRELEDASKYYDQIRELNESFCVCWECDQRAIKQALHCEACDYNVCATCKLKPLTRLMNGKIPSCDDFSVKCPKCSLYLHPLLNSSKFYQITHNKPNVGCICDECNKTYIVEAFHCLSCGYDVCLDCFGQGKVKQQDEPIQQEEKSKQQVVSTQQPSQPKHQQPQPIKKSQAIQQQHPQPATHHNKHHNSHHINHQNNHHSNHHAQYNNHHQHKPNFFEEIATFIEDGIKIEQGIEDLINKYE